MWGNVVESDIHVESGSAATTVNGYNSLTTFTEWDNADGADTNILYDSDIQLFTDIENHDITLADNPDNQAIDAGNLELAIQYAGAENVLRDYQNNYRVNEGGALDLGGVEYGSTPYYALAAPTELAFSAYDPEAGTVVLSWADSNANTRAFRVEVSTDGGSTWTFAGEALAANPSLTLNVDAETSYIFRVRAEKTISEVSAWTNAAWEPEEAPSTVVTTADDVVDATDGKISLREALAHMADGVGKTVTFDASLDGETIYLTQGELVFTNNTEYRGLKIDASSLENGITIDAQGQSRVFNIVKASSNFAPTFNNLTIANGYVDGNGAGIYSGLSSAYGVKLINCVVDGNVATGSGAGVYSQGATVSGTTFSNNEAGVDGGGLYFTGSNMSITASTFENNVADGNGGGLYVGGANNTFDALVFTDNSAANGGGLYFAASGKQTKATNLTFDGNKATVDGGGVYFVGSNTTFENLTVTGNEAGRDGGGIFAGTGRNTAMGGSVSGGIALLNSTITDNVAGREGGGVVTGSSGLAATSVLIADNVAETNGGGIRLYGSGSKLYNVTIAGNTATDGAGVYSQSYNAYYNSIILSNLDKTGAPNDIEHYSSRSTGYNVLSEYADWDADPIISGWGPSEAISYVATDGVTDYSDVFENPTAGDYTLAAGSPAIGSGDTSYVSTDTDLAGADRVRLELVDLGAFESPYAVTLAVPTISAQATSATTIELTIGEVANAPGYAYQISTVDGAWSDDAWVEAELDENGAIILSGLDSNTTYYFVAKALGTESGSCLESGVSETTSATTILSTPQNLGFNQYKRSNADGTRVYLLWDRIDDVVSYRVEYRELGTDEWVFVADYPQDLNILVQGQILYDYTPGVTYEFRVRAENENSVSEWANSTFTTIVAPTVEVAAIDGVAKTATLSFVAPESAAKYRVEILDRPFPTQAAIPYGELTYCVSFSADVQTWTCKRLQPGATYYCRVNVANASNTCVSDWTEFEFTVMAAPTDVVFAVDEADATRGLVSWTNADANATEFTVETSLDGVEWKVAGATTETTFELADWKPGDERYVRVRAQNGVSVSDWTRGVILSAPANATVAQLKRADADGSQLRVNWNDASELASQYRVEYREAGSDEWTLAGVRGRGSQAQSINDFTPGKTYELRVRAENRYGVSAWATTSLTSTAAPTLEVSAVDAETKRATIELSADPNATHLRVEVSTTPFETEATIASARLFRAVTLTANTQNYVLGNLDENTTYYVRVMSINETGRSGWTEVETISILSAPSDVVFTADETDATAGVLSWTNGAEGATEFLVETSQDGKVWTTVATTSETSVELADLPSSQEFYWRVRSQNDGGVSVWARGANLNAPLNVEVAQTKRADAEGSQLRLLWNDNSGIATQYRVEYREAGTTDWTLAGVRGRGSQAQSINDVTSGKTYELRVRAENKLGVSDWATASFTPMVAPTVELVSVEAAALTLELATDAFATNMRVEISTTPFATEAKIPAANLFRAVTLGGGEQTLTVRNLEAGATYYVRVRAINEAGVSDWAEVLEVAVPAVDASTPDAVSEAFAELFAEEDAEDDFWFEFEKTLGARK